MVTESSRYGKEYQIETKTWHNMLMSGKRKPALLPVHKHPFTLMQVMRYDKEGEVACSGQCGYLLLESNVIN